jgi:hypothetical protein
MVRLRGISRNATKALQIRQMAHTYGTVSADATAGRSGLSLARHTLSVVDVLHRITTEQRRPTADEVAVLGQWMGWGAVAPAMSPKAEGSWAQIGAQLRMSLTPDELAAAESATPTSYFTDPRLAHTLWQIATGVGFAGGRVLETGCGSGAFMAAAPDGLRLGWTGVERDPTSARICQAQFPGAQIIASPLERAPLPKAAFDLAIGNVPFADVQIYDRNAPRLALHNYCLWRALQVRNTLDASSSSQRAELVALGDLIGAIRLPSGALGEAGTRAVADSVVLRRRGEGEPQGGANWLEIAPITGAACGVQIVAASAFSPRTRTVLHWIFVWPSAAPCFLCP